MAEQYGATLEAWHHWGTRLGLASHLLPVVCNPGATISPDSNVAALGKTPSRYNFRREVAGFPKWTQFEADLKDIGKWESEPDYGICVQARAVRAIDIDVPASHAAGKIEAAIREALPHIVFPRRYREKTGKVLLPFLYAAPMPKRVIPVEGGVIEFLGDGQQWVAEASYIANNTAGRRKEGRYLWDGGWPTELPLLSDDDLEGLWSELVMFFATGDPKMARVRRAGAGESTAGRPGVEDPVLEHILKYWEVREIGRDGQTYIRCPFDEEHSSDSGPTETVYYPAGTGGYERGHFKCLHAHCMDRSDADYIEAMGFVQDLSDAPELPALVEEEKREIEPAAPARYITDKQGRKENRPYNHLLFLRSDACGIRLAYDAFTDNIIWCRASEAEGREEWREFKDEQYVQIVRQMDRHGFVVLQPAAIRPSVHEAAKQNPVDAAQVWLERLPKWDGVKRVGRFYADYLGTEDTTYANAVGVYMWSALAGRVMDPGCKADMVPVWVGEQSLRKTTAVEALVPHESMYAPLDLAHRDEEAARKMRGKLVIEFEELRGLQSRDSEAIKAFITRKVEEWTPKFKEFNTSFKRRCIFIGTHNPKNGFLSDDTGERRWLPIDVGETLPKLDIDAIVRDRTMLWAEALDIWRREGVVWEPAERLAKEEHRKFKQHDSWNAAVWAWLNEDDALANGKPIDRPYGWTAEDALVGALGYRVREIKMGDKQRMGRVLSDVGCLRKRVRRPEGLDWAYSYVGGVKTEASEEVA